MNYFKIRGLSNETKMLTRLSALSLVLVGFWAGTSQASEIKAEIDPKTVTLICHNANTQGLASLIVLLPDTRYATTVDQKTLEVIPGGRANVHVFKSYVMNPNQLYSVQSEWIDYTILAQKNGVESGKFINVPGNTTFLDSKKNIEITFEFGSVGQEILARYRVHVNGARDSALLKCMTWTGK